MRGVDDDVAPGAGAHVGHGADLAGHFFRADDLFAFHVAAAFGEDLILDVDARGAHFDEPFGDTGGVEGVAAAGIDIGHDRDLHGAADVGGDVEDVFHLDETDIREGEQRAGETEAGNLDGLKTGGLDDARAESAVAAGDDERLTAFQSRAKTGRTI